MTYNYCHVFCRQVVFCWTPWVLVVWRRGFVPETYYIFCGLWWFLLHSAIAFNMIFFYRGTCSMKKTFRPCFFGWRKAWLQNNHLQPLDRLRLCDEWELPKYLGSVEAFEHGNPQVSDKNPPKNLRKQVGGLIFFDFSYEAIWRGWFFVQGGWRWIRNFPQGSLISSYHTEMELKKSKFPETSGIYDKAYGCLDIGFVVVWGRMDSKASTQNAIVENEDS